MQGALADASRGISPLMLSFGDDSVGEFGPWIVTNKCDPACLALADRHYSRSKRSIGAAQFTRPGFNLVMRDAMGEAAWVWWKSKKRDDGFSDVIENTFFRNESGYLSSDLVRWAVYAAVQEWGIPKDGFITFVKDSAVRSSNPGANYEQVGFQKVGRTKVRKLTILQLKPERVEGAIREVRLIQSMIQLRDTIRLALENGEIEEAIWFYHEARRIEEELRTFKSERVRRKHNKLDSFEGNDDPLNFLYSLSADGWIPEDMVTYIE